MKFLYSANFPSNVGKLRRCNFDDDRAIELDWASENGECGGLVLLSSSPRRLATAVMKGEQPIWSFGSNKRESELIIGNSGDERRAAKEWAFCEELRDATRVELTAFTASTWRRNEEVRKWASTAAVNFHDDKLGIVQLFITFKFANTATRRAPNWTMIYRPFSIIITNFNQSMRV